jgi:hypothetical protein
MQTRFGASLLASVCALIFVYVLSSGPACYYWNRGYLSDNFVNTVYLPLLPIERMPVIGVALQSYDDWWIPKNSVRGRVGP